MSFLMPYSYNKDLFKEAIAQLGKGFGEVGGENRGENKPASSSPSFSSSPSSELGCPAPSPTTTAWLNPVVPSWGLPSPR